MIVNKMDKVNPSRLTRVVMVRTAPAVTGYYWRKTTDAERSGRTWKTHVIATVYFAPCSGALVYDDPVAGKENRVWPDGHPLAATEWGGPLPVPVMEEWMGLTQADVAALSPPPMEGG